MNNKRVNTISNTVLLGGVIANFFQTGANAQSLPPVIELSELNRSSSASGVLVIGSEAGDDFGRSVSGAGDVNNDGIDDLLISATGENPNDVVNAGRTYILFGNSDLPNTIETEELNQEENVSGLVIEGISFSDASGYSVNNAGDFNGDGIEDIFIGSGFARPNDIQGAGQSYVVFGSESAVTKIDLSDLDQPGNSQGHIINGINEQDRSGLAVSGAGDVNGDGFADVLVGAHYADPNDNDRSGESYILFGAESLPSVIELSQLNQTGSANGVVINGINSADYSGRTVSNAGDVNGDGVDDILIGAHQAAPNGVARAGEAYILFGNSRLPSVIDLSDLNQIADVNGVTISGINEFDFSGRSVSSANDFNADGFDDVLIGAFNAAPNGRASGQSYIVFGAGNLPTVIDLSTLNQTNSINGLIINGIDMDDRSGLVVSNAGDVNGDGVSDIMISADGGNTNGNNAGEIYVLFGGTDLADVIELSALNDTNDFDGVLINGASAFNGSFQSISNAGDINNDGVDDIIIGTSNSKTDDVPSGSSYLIYGSDPVLVDGFE